jgi:protein required for attachment to host cells
MTLAYGNCRTSVGVSFLNKPLGLASGLQYYRLIMTDKVASFLQSWINKSNSLWILVAHSSGARLFEYRRSGREGELNLIERIQFPEGRHRNRELGVDKPGRTLARARLGRSSYSSHEDEHTHTVGFFVRDLADRLEEGRTQNRFSQLVLIAESRFLGRLHSVLSRETSSLIIDDIEKNLINYTDHELLRYLDELLHHPQEHRKEHGILARIQRG